MPRSSAPRQKFAGCDVTRRLDPGLGFVAQLGAAVTSPTMSGVEQHRCRSSLSPDIRGCGLRVRFDREQVLRTSPASAPARTGSSHGIAGAMWGSLYHPGLSIEHTHLSTPCMVSFCSAQPRRKPGRPASI